MHYPYGERESDEEEFNKEELKEAAEDDSSTDPYKPVLMRGHLSYIKTPLHTHAPHEPQTQHKPLPPAVRFYRDVTKDSLSFQRMWNCLPQCYEPIYFGLRVALLVTFPLSILIFHPSTASSFPAGSLVVVVATANCQLHVGRQLAGTVLMVQTGVWAIIWGTITCALRTGNQEPAWWGMCFVGVLLLSFFPNLRGQRVMMSYGVIIMQMQHMPGGNTLAHSAKVASNLFLGLAFAAVQSFVPVPFRNSRVADRLIAKGLNSIGSIANALRRGVWSGRGFSANVETAQGDCDELGALIEAITAELFCCAYEPFELSHVNVLRRRRVELLKRLLVILYSACSTAQMLTRMTTIETRKQMQAWRWEVEEPTMAYMAALQHTLERLGKLGAAHTTLESCGVDDLMAHKTEFSSALQECFIHTMKKHKEVDAPALHYFFVFHFTLALLAEQLNSFGEELSVFDASPCKRTFRRFLEFFFLDFVNDFRYQLLGRVLLRTNADRRGFMNGLKLACAYCVAAAFTMKLNSDHQADTYYFGMAILTGIGLPTTSESLEVGVQRICALVFSMAVAYIARWKTQNFAQEMAVMICGCFVFLSLRDNQRYMQVAWYTSFIIPAAYGISTDRTTMIARIVDNGFAVMCYFAICACIFPVNPIRILWNKYVIVQKKMSETVTLLATATENEAAGKDADSVVVTKLSMASSNVTLVADLLDQLRGLIALCAKEPMIVKVPFPVETMNTLRMVLLRMLANTKMWVFGLELLNRERAAAAQPVSQAMLEAPKPILRALESASRIVFQDMINCVDRPLQWGIEDTVQHLDDFIELQQQVDVLFTRFYRARAHHRLAAQAARDEKRFAAVQSLSFESHTTFAAATESSPGAHNDDGHYAAVQRVLALPVDHETGQADEGRAPNFSFCFTSAGGDTELDNTALSVSLVCMSNLVHSFNLLPPLVATLNKFRCSQETRAHIGLREFFYMEDFCEDK